MKVLFFETTNATPHLETSLELAKKHLNQGDEVTYYFLGHAVPFAEFVRRKIPFFSRCLPERRAVNLLGDRLNYIEPSVSNIDYDSFRGKVFSSADELRSFKYKSYNAGLSALSSLISRTRTSKPDTIVYKELVADILISGISIYEYVLGQIDNKSPDLLYLFNGRFAVNRAILDAAIEKQIPFKIHERGSSKWRYVSNPWMPHDVDRGREEMLRHWKNQENAQKVQIAKQYFIDRRRGLEQSWKVYVAHQEKGCIPVLPTEKRILAYFSTNDEEFAALSDERRWDRWPDQLTAFNELVELVAKHSELHLVIRLHPGKDQSHPSVLEEWLSIELPDNATLVRPEDPVDTYELILRADVVVTSGSSTGIESVFWGTPSICLGPSIYSHLDAVYLPSGKEELEQMILSDSLTAYSENALPFGYYMATFGEEFVYYQPETLSSGKFMETNLQSGLCKYISLLSRIFLKITKPFKRRLK